ncbi:hypothetical protein RE6C_01549 [Rhodopirellula europaea 6C]|uniref:Uncharacterized protein n=1 Tax=Rhodopirellula europaea 6C TaxID=1263867 RepID=M2AY99_9BACT|nr:hypothetical protein RE6C_01549 [Rhodopirellula europaea 6C]
MHVRETASKAKRELGPADRVDPNAMSSTPATEATT